MEDVDDIKSVALQFFENRFYEPEPVRPTLDGIQFNRLSYEDSVDLEVSFSAEEIKDIIWNYDGNKSPGTDGFNFNFLKTCWNILKDDILNFVNEFHRGGLLPKAVTSSFLTLIPECDNPQGLSEFRPISLIGCLYKVISKLLASRLSRVIGKLISKS